jgi:hypothetical protein
MAPLPRSDTGVLSPHVPVSLQASTWGAITLHALFLYSVTPLVVPPPSDWPNLLFSQTFACINTPTISPKLFFLFKQPMKMEHIEYSEMSAQKIQTPWNLTFKVYIDPLTPNLEKR